VHHDMSGVYTARFLFAVPAHKGTSAASNSGTSSGQFILARGRCAPRHGGRRMARTRRARKCGCHLPLTVECQTYAALGLVWKGPLPLTKPTPTPPWREEIFRKRPRKTRVFSVPLPRGPCDARAKGAFRPPSLT
jgi:hypothetical protein